MKKRVFELFAACLLLIAVLVNAAGCSVAETVKAADLMEGIAPNPVTADADPSALGAAFADFAVRLFRAAKKDGKNSLVSPYSVLSALAMTANGARGETLSQMEATLGMKVGDLNRAIYAYQKTLSEGDALRPANAIWFKDTESFRADPGFLQTNADYYGANAYRAPFNDETKREINGWVKEKTDGMIPEILNEIPPNAVMYLVNALAFEAEWTKIYEKSQVQKGEFTNGDNSRSDAEFMYGEEYAYLESENATGFLKTYKGGRYAFAALLPDEGISVDEYAASLDGKALHELLSAPQSVEVQTAIPKFEAEDSSELSDALRGMGMPLAFDPDRADLSGIGQAGGNLYISRVLHKAFISVGEKGTRAGAATVVEVNEKSAFNPVEPKRVYLDRPFVYMLIDLETNAPFFIGTLATLAG